MQTARRLAESRKQLADEIDQAAQYVRSLLPAPLLPAPRLVAPRLVVGLVVVAPKGQYGAFGHAWTEYRQGDRWIVADAALISDDLQPRYLSLAWLQDEGPGYMVQFLEPLTNWARHVDVLGPGAALTDGKTP